MAKEDDEEIVYGEEEESSSLFRFLQIGVVLFAISGFCALAWYAYNNNENIDEKNVEIIKADKNPVKEAPANPGGMQIPNQDKTVYGLVNGNKEKPAVERILPATEEPLQPSNEAETWVNDKIKSPAKQTQEVSSQEAPKAAQPAVANNDSETAKPDNTKKAEQFNPQKVNNAIRDKKPTVPTSSPSITPKEEDIKEDKVEEKPVAKKEENKKLPAIRIQLGAFKSENDANKEWKKISSKFSDEFSGKSKYIVKKTIAGKGNFYRLQAAPFASVKKAEEFCASLTNENQACIIAKNI